jgi:integral membrane sensor domain MASE1
MYTTEIYVNGNVIDMSMCPDSTTIGLSLVCTTTAIAIITTTATAIAIITNHRHRHHHHHRPARTLHQRWC